MGVFDVGMMDKIDNLMRQMEELNIAILSLKEVLESVKKRSEIEEFKEQQLELGNIAN